MKAKFKPLGMAAAVAAASAGYAGLSTAQDVPNNNIGDLALVPYYTVQGGFGTGIHVINTSNRTQVVKFRFRRASDSLDALDFNIIMSPYDEWTGFMNDTDGTIAVTTQDTTCTAPLFADGRFEMPDIYRDGADEGYVEVIAMGSPVTETTPVAYFAKHDNGIGGDGLPRSCQFVEDNFLDAAFGAGLNPEDPRGVHSNSKTAGITLADDSAPYFPFCPGADGDDLDPDLCVTDYTDGGNFLKVSWFIRDADAGLEFGNDAVYLQEFSDDPWMTHQESGIFSGNLRGFDFPDLNGSSPFDGNAQTWTQLPIPSSFGDWTTDIGKYEDIRQTDVLGVNDILNDWSNNPDLNVGTDWVITIPGQYTMLDLPLYLGTLGTPGGVIGEGDLVCGADDTPVCDWRDIPVVARFNVWDREENLAAPPPGDRDVVISPSPPGAPPTDTLLRYEVNVVHWSPEEVLPSDYDEVDVSGLLSLLEPAVSGWAKLQIFSKTDPVDSSFEQKVCTWNSPYVFNPQSPTFDPNDPMTCDPVSGEPPMIGFVAWQRSFPDNPDANYGRAIQHSFESSSPDWGPITTP